MFVHHPKRDNSVAHAKIAMWILYTIGIPVYAYAMLLNITTWKSDVLFGVALILGALQAYHNIRKNIREDRKHLWEERKAELDNKLKEIEIREREHSLKN